MLAMPFDTRKERGEWASEHTKGTGHDNWRVYEEETFSTFIFQQGVQEDIISIDLWLDGKVSQAYKDQPLAQDWARVCKEVEERGESIAELILATGQNPRKPRENEAMERLLYEMADRAWTSILGIQHFTKDAYLTEKIMSRKLRQILERIPREEK